MKKNNAAFKAKFKSVHNLSVAEATKQINEMTQEEFDAAVKELFPESDDEPEVNLRDGLSPEMITFTGVIASADVNQKNFAATVGLDGVATGMVVLTVDDITNNVSRVINCTYGQFGYIVPGTDILSKGFGVLEHMSKSKEEPAEFDCEVHIAGKTVYTDSDGVLKVHKKNGLSLVGFRKLSATVIDQRRTEREFSMYASGIAKGLPMEVAMKMLEVKRDLALAGIK